jgi:hypothetical protein
MEKRFCPICNQKFDYNKVGKTYCSFKCKKTAYKQRAYEKNEGNWEWFFKGILNSREDRKDLSPEILIDILKKQNYKCALSGVKMTCYRKYHDSDLSLTWTNASIDRIKAGEEYNSKNVQLVCRAVNSFRGTLPVKKYLQWCKKIVEHNKVN